MTPDIENKIPKEDLLLFEKIRKSIAELPNINLSKGEKGNTRLVSCHMLARAIVQTYNGLKIVDGLFYPNFIHSWCMTLNGHIIDVYPVGIIGGPIFVSGDYGGPARWLYKQKNIESSFGLSFSDMQFKDDIENIKVLLKIF